MISFRFFVACIIWLPWEIRKCAYFVFTNDLEFRGFETSNFIYRYERNDLFHIALVNCYTKLELRDDSENLNSCVSEIQTK